MATNVQPRINEGRDLVAELQDALEGEVRFDDGSRALYATDLSMYRQVPIGVVVPRTEDDVARTVAACRSRGVPILGRGGGTSLAGQCCNVAVVIDFSKYLNRIIALDPGDRVAWVEPGVLCDQLRSAAAPHGLTFAPDPATHEYCTIGGMIGNNSCGSHSVMGGKTDDNVEALEILTYDGAHLLVGPTDGDEIERVVARGGRQGDIYGRLAALRDRYADDIRTGFPDIPRRVSGYNLDDLLPEAGFNVARALVGSESTCALTLRAKVRLVPDPPKRSLLVIGYPDAPTAADAVPELMSFEPTALEAVTAHVVENMRRKGKPLPGADLLPPGRAWLLIEFGGDVQDEADDRARRAETSLSAPRESRLFGDPADLTAIWEVREAGVGASRVPGVEDAWPSWEDAAVAPHRLGDYLREFEALLEQYRYAWTMYGHFGQGCVHTRIAFDPKTREGVSRYRSFMEEAANLVVAHGGSLSGEHGDGQARGELLPKMFGPRLVEAFREFKQIWDPGGKMNPGKLVDARPLDQDLRTGPDYHPLPVATHFRFTQDGGSLARATERCFGVGKCRRLGGGTMCPSFMVLREEQHTTRGRAHLLFEMLRGETITDGWKSDAVRESLDLCLGCKGCKGDCPVSVDIATYKAEFMAHYYAGRLRPRAAYTFGLIFYWARLASWLPDVANLVTHTPGLRELARATAGMASEREFPRFATSTFRDWFRARTKLPTACHGRVVLWPDTFHDHFEPRVAQSAVAVLESAGYDVVVPDRWVCCGRPVYDFGMIDTGKRLLRQTLDVLEPYLRDDVPVVGLEPSCISVFRDELPDLFPDDERARRLAQRSFLLGEFLRRERFSPPPLTGPALVQGHCHQQAILGFDAETELLERSGVDVDALDGGCCGMAGPFGFEAGERYDVSVAAGERVLLPAVRNAPRDALVLADGFSCREQIGQGTERRALHLAQVLHLGLEDGLGSRGIRPEDAYDEIIRRDGSFALSRSGRSVALATGLLALGAMSGAGLIKGLRRRAGH